jgi:hypothetical protein
MFADDSRMCQVPAPGLHQAAASPPAAIVACPPTRSHQTPGESAAGPPSMTEPRTSRHVPAAPDRSSNRQRADRRLSGVVPVYAAPDQGVCGVDMQPHSVHAVAA